MTQPEADGTVRIEASAKVEIDRSPAEVMSALRDPGTAVRTGQFCIRAFRAPDTPAGEVGEQHLQFSQHPDGRLEVEVEQLEELDFPHRVRVRSLCYPGDLVLVHTCEALPMGGTAYTQAVAMNVPDDAGRPVMELIFQGEAARSAAALKRVLEGGD
jgi:hypothetical protein